MLNEYLKIKQPRLRDILAFEIISWIGRNILITRNRIHKSKNPVLLDLGVGSNYTSNWVHADFYQIKPSLFKKNKIKKPEIQTDLRYPLNCQNNIIDGVYTGHTLEHLYPAQAISLLQEINRVLKPQAWLRINVPDLKILINYYECKSVLKEFNYECKAEAIGNYAYNWGHHSIWDEEILKKALRDTGFINIRKVLFGIEGADKRLIKEQEVRKFETLVMEAQKP